MRLGIEWLRRLEPLPPHGDLQRGFATEVADPLWMIGRQWQLGEHTGEDAGAPVALEMTVAHTPIDPVAGVDPTIVPAEAIIEGTALDWWTPGRRIRIGRLLGGALAAGQRKRVLFSEPLPEPYGDAFHGDVDGRALWLRHLIPANHPALVGLAADLPDSWDSHTLDHSLELHTGGTTLNIERHRGGDVDWYTADGPSDEPLSAVPDGPPSEVIPMRLQYPGAPLPRVFQIEDHAVDIGGYPPDRSHLATALLIELISDHSSDWFLAPVPAPHGASSAKGTGVVVTLSGLRVRNSFDEWDDLQLPPDKDDPAAGPDEPIGPWSLFKTRGLGRSNLVVWPTSNPVSGPVLDDIVFGVDEDANLMWAVEMRVDGRELTSTIDAIQALEEAQRTGTRDFSWLASTTLPEHWHPYKTVPGETAPDREVFGQGRVANLNGPIRNIHKALRDGPLSDLIRGQNDHKPHYLETNAVPYQGLRLERRYLLARGTDGRPVLWRQRRTVPLLGPPSSHLRFDVLQEARAE